MLTHSAVNGITHQISEGVLSYSSSTHSRTLASSNDIIWGRAPHEGTDAAAPHAVNKAAKYRCSEQRRRTIIIAAVVIVANPTIRPAQPAIRYSPYISS